jgi:hypothetical protein
LQGRQIISVIRGKSSAGFALLIPEKGRRNNWGANRKRETPSLLDLFDPQSTSPPRHYQPQPQRLPRVPIDLLKLSP